MFDYFFCLQFDFLKARISKCSIVWRSKNSNRRQLSGKLIPCAGVAGTLYCAQASSHDAKDIRGPIKMWAMEGDFIPTRHVDIK